MSNLYDQLPQPFTALAPMEGVTDIAFRQVVAKAARPDLFYTEFTNVNSYVSEKGRANALERLRFEPSEQPIIPQLWGTVPAMFAETAAAVKSLGYHAIDINMGCPDRHVVATGGGSALIRTPDLAEEIIEATKSANLPVSVKTRLGYTRPDEYETWLPTLLKHDLAALTIHLRTKKEMSKVSAHYELIPNIIHLRDQIAPKTKLILNGDFLNKTSAKPYFDQGANGVMIGRGVFQNPYCFSEVSVQKNTSDLFALLNYHLDLYEQYDLKPYDPLKRFYKIYINNFAGASDLRAHLMETKTIPEARAILTSFLAQS